MQPIYLSTNDVYHSSFAWIKPSAPSPPPQAYAAEETIVFEERDGIRYLLKPNLIGETPVCDPIPFSLGHQLVPSPCESSSSHPELIELGILDWGAGSQHHVDIGP